jgi:hypothetical protein
MSEAFDASAVVKTVAPTQVDGIKIGIDWTGDRQVSTIDFHFNFLSAASAKLGEGRLRLGPGAIKEAVDAVYTKLEAAATAAGKQPGDAEWPVRPVVETIWTNAKATIGDGTGLTPAAAATLVASKNWGQLMLRHEWAKSAVNEE